MKVSDIFLFAGAVVIAILLIALGKRMIYKYLRSSKVSRVAFFVILVLMFLCDRSILADDKPQKPNPANEQVADDSNKIAKEEILKISEQARIALGNPKWKQVKYFYRLYLDCVSEKEKEKEKEKGAKTEEDVKNAFDKLKNAFTKEFRYGERTVKDDNAINGFRKDSVVINVLPEIKEYLKAKIVAPDVADAGAGKTTEIDALNKIADFADKFYQQKAFDILLVQLLNQDIDNALSMTAQKQIQAVLKEKKISYDDLIKSIINVNTKMELLARYSIAFAEAEVRNPGFFWMERPGALMSKAGPRWLREKYPVSELVANKLSEMNKTGVIFATDIKGISVTQGELKLISGGQCKEVSSKPNAKTFVFTKYSMIITHAQKETKIQIAELGEIVLPKDMLLTHRDIVGIIRKGLDGKIKSLIAQLGDEQYKKREAAMESLRKIGGLAVPHLKDALKSTDDAEIKIRLDKLISELNEK